MGSTEMFELAGAFFVAWLVSFLLMPALAAWSHRAGMVVDPRLFGVGRPTVSYMGGMAVLVGIAATLLTSPEVIKDLWPYLLGGAALFSIGVMDDQISGGGLHPLFRLVLQTVVAAGTWWGGLQPVMTGTVWIDAVLTVFVLVAAVNSINLLDNMDGVAGTTSFAIAGSVAVLAAMSGEPLLAIFAATLSGATLGFLRMNFHNARVYLGNGGSMLLGFLLATSVLQLASVHADQLGIVIAIAVLAVPATDTGLVILSRIYSRRSVLDGGVDHLSHRLVHLGLTPRAAALAHGLAAAVCGIGVGISVDSQSATAAASIIFAFGVVGLGFLAVNMEAVSTAEVETLIEHARPEQLIDDHESKLLASMDPTTLRSVPDEASLHTANGG